MNYEMIKANLDPDELIKEIDKFAIHVRLTRITTIPGRKIPSVSNQVKCYTVRTFEAMEAMRNSRQPIVWYKAGGFDEARIIHDGRLVGKPEVKALTEEEKEALKLKEAEARKQKRLQNLAAARAAKTAK